MLRILHVTPDEKFFDTAYAHWEKDGKLNNSAVFITSSSNYVFKYIKSIDKVTILSSAKQVKIYFSSNNYDVIFFHSLSGSLWKYFKYIPKDKTVIWWAWGFDLYYGYKGLTPLIKLDLYKQITSNYIKKTQFNLKNIITFIPKLFLYFYYKNLRNNVIKRIDYFQPVSKDEFYLMKNIKGFRAKEFYYKDSLTFEDVSQNSLPSDGNILLGNSATPTNNHIDVLKIVAKFKKDHQEIIMPLNYGNSNYLKWLKVKLNYFNVSPIYDFCSKEKYYSMINNCSYCCIGTIRQQAMGNILYALSKGIKVFLYKNSILYNSLKSLGYVVYSIEDIDENSFKSSLTKEEIILNLNANKIETQRRNSCYLNFLNDMMYKYKKF